MKKKIPYTYSTSQDYIKITSLAVLKQLLEERTDEYPLEPFLVLGGGLVRSTKEIQYHSGKGAKEHGYKWEICHCISDSYCEYKTDKAFIKEEGNIMLGIKNGAFWIEAPKKK